MSARVVVRRAAYLIVGMIAGLVVRRLLNPSSQVLGTVAIVAVLLSVRYELAAIRIALQVIAERLGGRL